MAQVIGLVIVLEVQKVHLIPKMYYGKNGLSTAFFRSISLFERNSNENQA
jgi:hypothetical protein